MIPLEVIIIQLLLRSHILLSPPSNCMPTTLSKNKFNFNKADWSIYSSLVTSFLPSIASNHPLTAYADFTDALVKAASLSIPKLNAKQKCSSSLIWWNNECSEAVEAKTLAFRCYRLNRSTPHYLLYKKQCAITRCILKLAKRSSWQVFTENLHSSTPFKFFWETAKKFRRCIYRQPSSHNKDWFSGFCSKVTSHYVPTLDEANLNSILNDYPIDSSSNSTFLIDPLLLSELEIANNSRRSVAAGMDQISPLLIKYLPFFAKCVLLNILNDLLGNCLVRMTSHKFKVIPIPKPNASQAAYRPIAMFSVLCKLTE